MPCDSVSTIKTVYRHTVANADTMLEAAKRLGWRASKTSTSVVVSAPSGTITCTNGATQTTGAQAEAEHLMVEYARVTAEQWADSYPDRYEEVSATQDARVLNIRKPGGY